MIWRIIIGLGLGLGPAGLIYPHFNQKLLYFREVTFLWLLGFARGSEFCTFALLRFLLHVLLVLAVAHRLWLVLRLGGAVL